jgi:hypothetical protein
MNGPRDTTRLWQLVAVIAIAGAVLSLAPLDPARSLAALQCDGNSTCDDPTGPVTCADGRHVSAPTDCNSLCGNPQDLGTRCATFDSSLCVEAVCGSAGECGNAQTYVPPSCNDNNDCTVDSCDACADTCAGACVHQPDFSGALDGPVTCADGRHVSAPTDCNSLCGNPQDVGTLCATFDSNLCVEAVCGSAGECGNAKAYVPSSCDDGNNCTIDTCDVCAGNRAGACAHQQDLTAAGCNLAPGTSCSDPSQCASTFCADGVCCNRVCDAAFETCNRPGTAGLCVGPAPVPVVSARGVLVIGCLLTGIGLWSLRRVVGRFLG